MNRRELFFCFTSGKRSFTVFSTHKNNCVITVRIVGVTGVF
ncbi:hypothetical protein ALQ92_200102 [Pseudomonas syringae pv. pisi]|uniref:Uncharacterized protein n=1 Tax=Pseudomonas savastanoi pv. phaseolicola TaxID=319 RepID=A0A7Z6USN4_PSESH|nr:hypothetical protein ALQ92_200102 [Pseudomonas syringae pv. pisi]RMU86213.1 hypothetical protein ALP21_200221 [Pseudomonas savastanoi pv. phaseolicola]